MVLITTQRYSHHINIQDFESNNDLQVFHYEELVTDYNEYQYL